MVQIILVIAVSLACGWRYISNTNATNEELEIPGFSFKTGAILCGVITALVAIFTLLNKVSPVISMILSGVVIIVLAFLQLIQQETKQLRAIFWLSLPFCWSFWRANSARMDLIDVFNVGFWSLIWPLVLSVALIVICGIIRFIMLKAWTTKAESEDENEDSEAESDEDNSEDETEESDSEEEVEDEPEEDNSEGETDETDSDDETDEVEFDDADHEDEEHSESLWPTIVTAAIVVITIIAVIIILK